ncbi:hypothetical protein K503DRAFT_777105 [Rhizopogon vinicolor AM-OR11-026]|uniref:Uncharacterized protein n=1 Tax=Rhizopogon vinicolor AM-OR11-026 TaxID=1314800 RepID=A0A1B7MHB0_9AGAM|nr:hypothetical protein K503DRAFT_777105 [Rhizopogon vinicolor AM-OR11-026]
MYIPNDQQNRTVDSPQERPGVLSFLILSYHHHNALTLSYRFTIVLVSVVPPLKLTLSIIFLQRSIYPLRTRIASSYVRRS